MSIMSRKSGKCNNVGLIQICSKICPKHFWEFPKILLIMLFMLPIMLVLCSNMNNLDVRFYSPLVYL